MADLFRHPTCGAPPAGRVDALLRALARHGLPCETTAPGPGLLMFATGGAAASADPVLHERLRDASRSGAARIVAVHLGDGELCSARHWSLLAAGAADVIDGQNPDEAAAMLAARVQRWAQIDALVASPLVKEHLVGDSPAWQRLVRQAVEVAAFSDAGALIVGESGTGKELTARLVHTLWSRGRQRDGQQAPLVVLDCSTVQPELAGSEFFGHERGAFTGASAPRDGAFALADRGTLFLDEVGELPAAQQAQLLRVIQERSYKRIGGSAWQRSEFRLVCATNRELDAEVARGAFRSDLYWRIAGCILRMPSLRERREDILPLAQRFLAEALATPPAKPPQLQPAVREHLEQRPYPGNVRELRQLMQRIAARHVGDGPITVGDLPDDERPGDIAAAPPDWRHAGFDDAIQQALRLGVGLRDISAQAANTAIRIAVGEEGGNLQRAARRLGVTDRALQMRRAGGQ